MTQPLDTLTNVQYQCLQLAYDPKKKKYGFVLNSKGMLSLPSKSLSGRSLPKDAVVLSQGRNKYKQTNAMPGLAVTLVIGDLPGVLHTDKTVYELTAEQFKRLVSSHEFETDLQAYNAVHSLYNNMKDFWISSGLENLDGCEKAFVDDEHSEEIMNQIRALMNPSAKRGRDEEPEQANKRPLPAGSDANPFCVE